MQIKRRKPNDRTIKKESNPMSFSDIMIPLFVLGLCYLAVTIYPIMAKRIMKTTKETRDNSQ